jgi:virulence factor Mce-like protein
VPAADTRAIRRIAGPLALAAAVLVVALVLLRGGGDGDGHKLYATVSEATNLIKGQELKAGGGKIGVIDRVQAIDHGAKARLTLRIEDRAWPLPRGTRFAARFGGTASFYNRHILVTPGRAGAPALPDGGTVPARDFTIPVEVDELLAVFDSRVRTDLKSFVNRSGVTFSRARQPLEDTLDRTPQAVRQAAAVFGDLTDDRGALDVTLRKTDAVVDAVHRADPSLSRLLGGAASTFAAIGDEQQQLKDTVGRLPAMLTQTQETLGRAEHTLHGAGALARRIAPGVRQLRTIAAPLGGVLTSVQDIAPDAKATLATVRRSTPQLNRLLARATAVAPQLGSIGDKAVVNLKCIRPYSPELAGLLTTWGDFMSWSDGKDKILRAQIQNFLPANYNSVPAKPADIAKVFSGLKYGFPRPPGYLAGQPWYQPECGAGPDAVDPSKDQEAERPIAHPLPATTGGRR